MAKPYDHLFKIIIIGGAGVGKTCILNRFCHNEFYPLPISTIGIDFKIRTIELDGEKFKLQIWDTTGSEQYLSITTPYYRGAMGIILVYDVTNEKSFENVRNWIQRIELNSSTGVETFLLGNKCGMKEERKVSKEEGEELAVEYGMKFMEIDAKSSTNIEEAFFTLVRDIRSKKELDSANTPIKSIQGHKQKETIYGFSKKICNCCLL